MELKGNLIIGGIAVLAVAAIVVWAFLTGGGEREGREEPQQAFAEYEAENLGHLVEAYPVHAAESLIDGLVPGLNFDQYPGLWEAYRDFFMIGAAGDHFPGSPWDSIAAPRDALVAFHYNAWTFENSMKPQPIRGSMGQATFNTDRVNNTINGVTAAFRERNTDDDIAFIGHTLAWHSQTPEWMWDGHDGGTFDRDIALANLHEHIDFVMMEWGHQLQAIDVVNEAMGALNPADPADWRTSLTNHAHGWSLALGYEWVELAFLRAAYIADREGMDVVLYYNDFGLDGLAKATAVAAMVAEINDRHANLRPNGRKLIEGIGMQGHYNMNTNIENVAYNIRRFAALGVRISITELDISMLVTCPSGFLTPEQEILQAQIYAQLFQVLRRYAAGEATEGSGLPRVVERVTFWGTNDGNSWRGGSRPLLFNPINDDGEITAKYALLAVLDPDRFLELHPVAPPEPIVITGVYAFTEGEDGFTGINIILGEAFTPKEGATYRLFVEYMIRGTFGLEARWIYDNSRDNFTENDLFMRQLGGPASVGGSPDAPISRIPARFIAGQGAVNGSSAWLNASFRVSSPHDEMGTLEGAGGMVGYFSIPGHDLAFDEPFPNIALRGLDGENGIEFVQVQLYRVGDDIRPDELLINWPELVPEPTLEGTQGIYVFSLARGDNFSSANIIIGSGRDVWPFADAPEYGDDYRAFAPAPGGTYRISFNVTSQGTNGWRVRWIPGLGGETYTTADAAIVNDHPFAMDAVADIIPAHFIIGGEAGETYTLITEITLNPTEEYMGLIGNIALRGTGGGNAFDINWVRIEKITNDQTELLAFYPYGL